MSEYKIELGLYQDCLYEIKKRIEVISNHINRVTTEKYLIVEVETVCLQFRKILEKIALMSLVANKNLYEQQNKKFAKHYHAERIMRDLERVNPDFYPVPTRLSKGQEVDEWIEIKSGYLTKKDLVNIYEICGGMMHAQNPFASKKPLKELQRCFSGWLSKISTLLNHHHIKLVGGEMMIVAMMERKDNGLPQAVIFKSVD
ncbi:hypothetical protein ACKA01_05050 [Helcococcus kunzii]|uniref:hypothetical protein n=1 Tax=Helcococcus kunzii TaxID=40091 RepID=UPI0038A63189